MRSSFVPICTCWFQCYMNLIGPPKIYRRCCQDCRYFSQIPCTNNCIQWCYQSRGPFLGCQYSFHHSNCISNIPYQYPTGSICIDLSGMDKILEINGIISSKFLSLGWLILLPAEDSDLICQSGARWEDINQTLKTKGIPLFFPVSPLGSYPTHAHDQNQLDPGPGAVCCFEDPHQIGPYVNFLDNWRDDWHRL